MEDTKYLTTQQIIEINKEVLKKIRVKRADSHRVLNRKKLEEIVRGTRELGKDLYEKAAYLLMGVVKEHPFASGTRRTAYTATRIFLEANGEALHVKYEATVFTGIREGFYTRLEVIDWLKGNAIRKFSRA